MKRESPEYETEEFFPTSNITFSDKQSIENGLERQLIFEAFPEKGNDVFDRALRIAESANQNLKEYVVEAQKLQNLSDEDDKQASICLL